MARPRPPAGPTCACGKSLTPQDAVTYGDRCEDCYAARQGTGQRPNHGDHTKRRRAGKVWTTIDGLTILGKRL